MKTKQLQKKNVPVSNENVKKKKKNLEKKKTKQKRQKYCFKLSFVPKYCTVGVIFLSFLF